MKRYETLFILNTAGKEEGIKDLIDKISAEITAAGGKLETVQKMDKRPFSRVADKRYTSGFYVNFIFEGEASIARQIRARFVQNPDVFRILTTLAAPAKALVIE